MDERTYQRDLIRKLRTLFPECHILKNDPSQLQGVPDLLILYNRTWAMLEVKMDEDSNVQPNQEYYVNHFDRMSFASFINPSNEEEVLDALQQTFGLAGKARVS